jgi:hypothetical protein
MRPREEHRAADRPRQEEREEARYSTDRSLSAPGEAEALRAENAELRRHLDDMARKWREAEKRAVQTEESPLGHAAAEAGCVHRSLDERGIPRADESGLVYSLWGRVLRALEAERARQWRPIETAPKDGTEILLWCGQPVCGNWSSDTDDPERDIDGWVVDVQWPGMTKPTHWQPIQKAPDELDRMLGATEGGEHG